MMKKISSDSSSKLISEYIRTSDLDEMSKQREIDRVCSLAIKYIGISTKSSGRIREYLIKQEINDDMIDQALDDLQRRGYLNDSAIAAKIARQRTGRRAVSKKAMRYYMQNAGLPDMVINDQCEQLPSDSEAARQALTGKYPHPEPSEKARMMRFLGSRGFSGGISVRVITDYLDSLHVNNE